jgi:hypothetical protein
MSESSPPLPTLLLVPRLPACLLNAAVHIQTGLRHSVHRHTEESCLEAFSQRISEGCFTNSLFSLNPRQVEN